MTNSIEFPNSIYEFLLDNSFKDTDEVYTNGSLLIPTFRVKQAIEHYYKPCEDAISREAVIRLVEQYPDIIGNRCSGLIADIKHLPSVTPQQENGEWIEVWDKDHLVILAYKCSECGSMRNTKTSYCADCGADMRCEEE